MNIHKNARLTPAGRELLVRRLFAGEKPAEVAAALGVSRRTVWKWVRRYREEGSPGLFDRSSRPLRSPKRIGKPIVADIVGLRRSRWSSIRIAGQLGVAVSTVGCTLRRHGLGRLRDLEQPRVVIRYERERPGELVHLDIKKLGRIGCVGHRIHGDRRRAAPGIGWEHLHVCVDDATRLSYCEMLPDEKGVTAAQFLTRAVTWFAQRNVTVERVMTDNGSGYRSLLFRESIGRAHARHIRTRPYTPRTNGKAERFIQSAIREWAYAHPFQNSSARTDALADWLGYYNDRRPHAGIRGRSPQQRLADFREQRL